MQHRLAVASARRAARRSVRCWPAALWQHSAAARCGTPCPSRARRPGRSRHRACARWPSPTDSPRPVSVSTALMVKNGSTMRVRVARSINDQRSVGFDNERGTGDHGHRPGPERPCPFAGGNAQQVDHTAAVVEASKMRWRHDARSRSTARARSFAASCWRQMERRVCRCRTVYGHPSMTLHPGRQFLAVTDTALPEQRPAVVGGRSRALFGGFTLIPCDPAGSCRRRSRSVVR